MLQGYRKRHMNVLGPAVSPTVANGIVTQVGVHSSSSSSFQTTTPHV
jgi:hypothetical protein